MKKITLTAILLLIGLTINAQQIRVGDQANNVKGKVERLIKDYNSHSNIGQMKMWSNVLWSNGKIKEVIIERKNVPHVSKTGEIHNQSFKTRYIMKGNVCSRILIEYYNVSLAILKQQCAEEYRRIDNYYFERGYNSYVTLFLSSTGLATKEIHQIPYDSLPLSIRSKIEIESNE